MTSLLMKNRLVGEEGGVGFKETPPWFKTKRYFFVLKRCIFHVVSCKECFFFVYYYPAFYLYAGPRNRLFFHKFFFNPHVLIQTGRISSVEYFNRNIFLFFTPFYSFPGKKAVRYKKRACAALPLRRYDVCLCGHAVPACPFSSFIRAARVQRSAFHRSPVFLPSFSGI